MAQTWTKTDPMWASLNKYQRAAAMALMEADRMNPQSARNALGAMINRSAKSGVDLGDHVSQKIYQPTIESAQQARLKKILNTGEFNNLTSWAERRSQGLEPDPVQGATHFLAPEKTMLALEARDPGKYKNWGPRGANWTGYDPKIGAYKGVITRDDSHAFLAPEGPYSVEATAVAAGAQPTPNILTAGYGRESGPGHPMPEQAMASAAPPAPAVAEQPWLSKALGLSPTMSKGLSNIASVAGAFGKASGDGGSDKQLAELRQQAAQNSNAALNDEEQRAQAAMKSVLSRRQRSAFG